MALLAGPPRSHENGGGRRLADVGLGVVPPKPVEKCDVGALRAPRTVALEHEHQTPYRRKAPPSGDLIFTSAHRSGNSPSAKALLLCSENAPLRYTKISPL